MKKLIALVATLAAALCLAQDPNPQSEWSTTLLYANPSLYLNFNDYTTAFLDQISNQSFVGTKTVSGATYGVLTGSYTGGLTSGYTYAYVGFPAVIPNSGNVESFSVYFQTAPSAGQILTITASDHPYFTPYATATVTPAAVSGLQTFNAPTDFTSFPFHYANGTAMGIYLSAGTGTIAYSSSGSGNYTYFEACPGAPIIGTALPSCNGQSGAPAFTATLGATYTSGTVTPRQPGFDSAQVNNTSAEFPYNGWNAAPNNTLGSIDWNSPWTMLLHVDRLNFNQTGTMILASKGDIGGAGPWWKLFVAGPNTTFPGTIYTVGNGFTTQFCFERESVGAEIQIICTNTSNGSYNMPNGLNYDVIVTDDGTGSTTSLNLVVNGLGSISVEGSATAPFSRGGTGTVSSTINATSLPLIVPGAVSSGSFTGIDQGDSTQPTTYVDEFAIFPGNLTQTQIQSLLYQSKFQQLVLYPPPTNRVPFIFDDDGCGDADDMFAMQAAIAAQNLGYIKLIGVIQENSGAAVFRQMLDQAGLANVPVGVVPGQSEGCSVYNPAIYNATTPTDYADYPTDVQVYRQAMVQYPSSAIEIFMAGPIQGPVDFLQSGADSISPLTGQQLWNLDVTNGATVFTQGGFCTATSPPNPIPCVGSNGAQGPLAANQYLYSHLNGMPMISIAGTPQSSGPGPLYTRTSKDPMFTFTTGVGSDMRTAWDSLPMTAFISSQFYGGVVLSSTGGTGYANVTPFTSSGGGTNCKVAGYMTANSGVPNGFTSLSGLAQPINDGSVVVGMGSGCTSAPTINLTAPTGTGVSITAYPTMVCGTDIPTSFPSTTDFTATGSNCANQYVAPMSFNARPGTANIFQWYLNSLIDPPPNGRPLSAQ